MVRWCVASRATTQTDFHPPRTCIAVIEVSDSSLAYDRSTKLAIYARAGIPQYLIVNVQHACIEVHEHPAPEHQRYENVTVFRAGSEFELRAGGRERLAVDPAHLLP